MTIIVWTLIIALFAIAYIGLIYPIIPSVLFIFAGFIVYGLFFTFSALPWWFWLGQVLLVIVLFAADTIAGLVGVKAFGGTKAGMWGSTIGLIVGPFIIPFFGILIFPFVFAVAAELLVTKSTFKEAVYSGFGSLVGFFTSIVTKGIIQTIMIVIFIILVV